MHILGQTFGYIAFSILHFAQFVLAVTVIGLYATDLHHANQQGKYMDSKWVFAVVVGALSAVTSVLYFIPFILRFMVTVIWNWIILILWIAVFGVFGSMYIKEDPEGNGDIQRMKNAVWVDLANVILWFFGSVAALAYYLRHRERHSRFTGRAKVWEPTAGTGRTDTWKKKIGRLPRIFITPAGENESSFEYKYGSSSDAGKHTEGLGQDIVMGNVSSGCLSEDNPADEGSIADDGTGSKHGSATHDGHNNHGPHGATGSTVPDGSTAGPTNGQLRETLESSLGGYWEVWRHERLPNGLIRTWIRVERPLWNAAGSPIPEGSEPEYFLWFTQKEAITAGGNILPRFVG